MIIQAGLDRMHLFTLPFLKFEVLNVTDPGATYRDKRATKMNFK